MRKLKNKELKRLNLKEFKNKKKLPVVIVLDNIRSAHNVGSVFRTSDAFLIEKIMLCGICPVPPKNEIRKTALGATESVDWEYFSESNDCINTLTKLGYKAFEKCISLERVVLLSKLESLSRDCFKNCNSSMVIEFRDRSYLPGGSRDLRASYIYKLE